MILNLLEITVFLLSQILLFAEMKNVTQDSQDSTKEQPLPDFP